MSHACLVVWLSLAIGAGQVAWKVVFKSDVRLSGSSVVPSSQDLSR